MAETSSPVETKHLAVPLPEVPSSTPTPPPTPVELGGALIDAPLHVMVALDESKFCTDVVLPWCAKNIRKDAKICFLHAYDYSPLTILPGPGMAPPGVGLQSINTKIQGRAIQKGKKFLQSAFKTAVSLGFKPKEMKLLVGAPVTTAKAAIADYVNERNPDLLICGSRGIGSMGRMFLGSVSDYCVHNCQCPVVVVKPKQLDKTPSK